MDMTSQPSIEENRIIVTQLSIEGNFANGFNMMTAVEDTDDYVIHGNQCVIKNKFSVYYHILYTIGPTNDYIIKTITFC